MELVFSEVVVVARNQLLWGQSTSSKNEVKQKSITPVSSSSSISSNTKGHARTPSSASMASTSSATSISDVDIDTGNEIDSKTDSDDSPLDLPQLISEDFTQHLQGLYHSLEQLTEVALYLTSRYQNNLTFTLSRVLVEFVALLQNIQESISSHDTQLKALSSQQLSTQGAQQLLLRRVILIYIALAKGWPIAIEAAYDGSRDLTIYRLGFQPTSRSQVRVQYIYKSQIPEGIGTSARDALMCSYICQDITGGRIGFSFYTKTERELYRKIVEEIIMCEEGAVSSTICVNLNTSLPTNITKSDAERLIKKLVGEKWLNNQLNKILLRHRSIEIPYCCGTLLPASVDKWSKAGFGNQSIARQFSVDHKGSISLGVRTLAEMEPYLTSVYKDYIKKCTLCHNIVILMYTMKLKENRCTSREISAPVVNHYTSSGERCEPRKHYSFGKNNGRFGTIYRATPGFTLYPFYYNPASKEELLHRHVTKKSDDHGVWVVISTATLARTSNQEYLSIMN
uniref:Uncharacterized protein n=1 Tax=Timema cristinae TaxID=61476 RepID=A0A7R9CN94_TIMCR|nr:unnamed protein product [Timema cristinae]